MSNDPELDALEAEWQRRQIVKAENTYKQQLDSPGIADRFNAIVRGGESALKNGLSLGWYDELAGTVNPQAAINQKARLNVSRENAPVSTFLAEGIGAAVPAVAATAMTGGGALPVLATNAAMGAAYGAGDANEGDKLQGGIVGGGLGAVLPPALSGVGKSVGWAASKLNPAYQSIAKLLSSESGAISNKAKPLLDQALTPAEKFGVGQSAQKGITADEWKQGLAQYVKTRQDVPEYTLADAMGQNKAGSGDSVLDTVNFLRSQPETKTEVSSRLVPRAESRADRAVSAIDNLFENGAPEDSTKHLFALRDAAKNRIEGLKLERQKEAEMMYKMAHDATPGRIDHQPLNRLMRKDIMQEAQQAVRGNFPDELRFKHKQGLHELDKMKQYLDDQYDKFSNKANSGYDRQLAAKYQKGSQQLRDTIDEINPYYQQAREAFADSSADINKLEGRKWGKEKQIGLFAKILNAQDANNPELIGRAIDNLEPAQIKNLKKMLGKEHQGTFEDAYLQYIKNQMRNSRDTGQSPIVKFWTKREDNSTNRDVIKAAIGKEKYKQLSKQFDAELAMHETYVRSHTGSQTQPRQAESEKAIGMIASALKNTKGAIADVVQRATGPSDAVKQQWAKILLTDQAWKSGPKIEKALRSKEYQKELAKIMMQAGGKQGRVAGITASGKLGGE